MASKFEKAFNEMQPEAKQTGTKLERGYKIVKESKNAQLSAVIRPSTKEALNDIAADQGKKRNELINEIFEAYIKDYYKEG